MTEKQFCNLAMLALAVAGALAYANTFRGDWVWDDASSVLLNEHIRQPGMLPQLFQEDQHPFGKGQGNFYRPLVAASFMLDYLLSYDVQADAPATASYPEVKPLLFHLSNLLWHVAAAVLLFILLRRMDAPRWVSVAATMLFVLHPLHTEAVAYISGRADMMSGAFMFGGLSLCLSEARVPRRYLIWGAGLLCFVGALLSKEASMMFPVLLAILIFLRAPSVYPGETLKSYYRTRVIPLAAAAGLLALYGILRATVLNFSEATETAAAPILTRLVETGQAFAFYMQKLFLPTHLHMEQTLAGVPGWTSIVGWGLFLLILLALLLAWRGGQRRIVIGLSWFLAAWLPVSGIFPLNAPMAEHWMYVPMAGFWWAVCEALWLLAERAPVRPVVSVAVAALCIVFLSLTVHRNEDWRSNDALFRATLAENSGSLRVHYNLAVTYEALQGNYAGARRHFEKALAEYEAQKRARSLSGDTNYLLNEEIEVRLSLGNLGLDTGDYVAAAQQFSVLTNQLSPQNQGPVLAQAALGYARSLLALGDYLQASEILGRAASLAPEIESQARALLREGVPPAGIS